MLNPFKNKPFPGELHTSSIIRRYENNPILSAENVPYPATYVFNAGVARYQGKYFIAPRIDCRRPNKKPGEHNMLYMGTGLGVSDDGINFTMYPEIIRVHYKGKILPWVVDSRLTVLEDGLYLSFCFENQHSERPGIAKWRGEGVDFDAVTIGIPQQRNMIICPEKTPENLYMRLERPSNQWKDPFHIWYSKSPDMRYWGDSELLLGCEDVPWATAKIGAGAPFVKTDRGWLLIFHAVDENPEHTVIFPDGRKWYKRYTAGAALFSLQDPTELIAITKEPLLVAEAPYETGNLEKQWVEFTVFPCGAVLEDDNNTLRIYYGAGDCNTNLAFTTLDELWTVMAPCKRMAKYAMVPWILEEWDRE